MGMASSQSKQTAPGLEGREAFIINQLLEKIEGLKELFKWVKTGGVKDKINRLSALLIHL